MRNQKALVVGVSNYPDPSWALPGVANDAREMANLLGSAQGQFQGGSLTTLTDSQATSATILAGLNVALGGAQSDETVFIYMAGHGLCRNGKYYFLAHDTDPRRLDETGVPLTSLKALFESCASRQVFIWLDFCHSGGAIERSVGGSPLETGREVIDRELRVVRGHGKVIVAACTGDQTAKESQLLGHGFFTHALVEGLRGQAAGADGRVTATGLYEYIVRRVEAESPDQCPVLYGQMQGLIVLMHHEPRQLAGSPANVTGGGKAPAQAAATVCDSSGDWCLLHTTFLQADQVNHNADGTFTVEVEARSAEENAAIQQLHPSRADRPRAVAFAHGDDGLIVAVSKLEGRSAGGRRVWTATLTPANTQPGSPSTEMSVQGHSADEIAQMCAGRLLLNDPPPTRGARQGVGLDLVEWAMQSKPLPCKACILQAAYAEYKGRPDLFLPRARLSAIYALRASDTVEQVLELLLGPVHDGKCHVRFRGLRAKRFSNKPPFPISLEGDCTLE
jgi:hypothetical protein